MPGCVSRGLKDFILWGSLRWVGMKRTHFKRAKSSIIRAEELSLGAEMITNEEWQRDLAVATAAGWWSGCVAAGRRWSSSGDDTIEEWCHEMLAHDIERRMAEEDGEQRAGLDQQSAASDGTGAGTTGGGLGAGVRDGGITHRDSGEGRGAHVCP